MEYVTNTPVYSVSANPTALTISSPGQSVSTTLTFTSQNGLYGSGVLSSSTCGIPTSEEITCSLAPFILPANGTTTAVLTFKSTAAYSSASARTDSRSGQPMRQGQMLSILGSACFLCLAPFGLLSVAKGDEHSPLSRFFWQYRNLRELWRKRRKWR